MKYIVHESVIRHKDLPAEDKIVCERDTKDEADTIVNKRKRYSNIRYWIEES